MSSDRRGSCACNHDAFENWEDKEGRGEGERERVDKKTTPNGPTASPRISAGTPSSAGRSPNDSLCRDDEASPATERQRYERLREEAAKQGMKMLEEEKERNREMTELLQAQIKTLESELESCRSRLGKKVKGCDALGMQCTARNHELTSCP